MKHWLAIGLGIIVMAVFAFRGRIASTSATVPSNATTGIGVDRLPASYRPATTRHAPGIPAGKLEGVSTAPTSTFGSPRPDAPQASER